MFTNVQHNTTFEALINLICPIIIKQNTNFCKPISVQIVWQFVPILRFLATGDSYRYLMYLFKVLAI